MIEDYQRILKYYGKHLILTDSSDSRFVGWSSKDAQENRWNQLVLDHNLDGCSVLDVGCGVGDLLGYLQKYSDISYTGIDINTTMIKEAYRKNPDAAFLNGSLSRLAEFGVAGLPSKWDYVFASGAFTVRLDKPSLWDTTSVDDDSLAIDKNMAYITQGIEDMCKLANKHVAFNFLDDTTEWKYRHPKLYYYNRDELLNHVRNKWDGYLVTGYENEESDSTIHIRLQSCKNPPKASLQTQK